MRYSLLALAATVAFVSADCQDDYNTCIASGANETKCQCDLATCSGEDNARTREFCSSALASLSSASSTSPSTVSTSASIITGTAGSQPSGQAPITAPENSIPLGGTCSDDAQCAGDAECWGSNAGIIRRCGNFNAGCKVDADCAYNTCNGGLCNGFLASESYLANTASATATATSGSSAIVSAVPTYAASSNATMTTASKTHHANYTLAPTGDATWGGAVGTETGSPQYTGSASTVGYGFAAVVFGLAAWAL